MTLTRRQQIVVAVIPKISSVLSMFGSTWIITEVLTNRTEPRAKRHHSYHRLLLAMSVYDVLENFCNFASTWPVPEGTEGVVWARGTTATCSLQGYFLTLGVAIPIYNAMLSLYYVLVICYKYPEDLLRRRIEPAMHLVAFAFAFGTATYSAFAGLYNNANLWCWIAPLPSDCSEGNCVRGENAWIYRYAFYFGPLWFCILMATTCTLMVYFYVRKIEASSAKYRHPQQSLSCLGAMISQSHGLSSRPSCSRVQPTTSRTIALGTDEESSNEDDSSGDSSDGSDRDDVDAAGLPSIQEQEILEQAAEKETMHIEQLHTQANGSSNTNDTQSTIRQANIANSQLGIFPKWKSARTRQRLEYKRSRAVFDQALWYLGTFLITHIWSTTSRAAELASGGTFFSFALTVIHSFFDPLQGFLNYFVYQRPRYLKIREKQPEIGRIGALSQMLKFTALMDRSVTGIGSSDGGSRSANL